MYLDVLVTIPDIKGKITILSRGKSSYVNYEVERVYDPVKKYNIPKRVTIGKVSDDHPDMMIPNHNFLYYFPEVKILKTKITVKRSNSIRVGMYLILQKIFANYKISDLLKKHFAEEELGLFLDLLACTITNETNAAQYYPLYAYEHPLFTKDMQIYDDKEVQEFLNLTTTKEKMELLAPLFKTGIELKFQEIIKHTKGISRQLTPTDVIKELEKIEIIREKDQSYQFQNELTKLQKTILNSFGLDETDILRLLTCEFS